MNLLFLLAFFLVEISCTTTDNTQLEQNENLTSEENPLLLEKVGEMRIREFEKKTGIRFEEALKTEGAVYTYLDGKQTYSINAQEKAEAVFRREWGIVEFSSKPDKAQIFIDSKLYESLKTPSSAAFRTGTFQSQIKLSTGKSCVQKIKVENGKTSKAHCE